MPKGKDIVKKLAKIAAREIQNIKGERVFPNVYETYELSVAAFGDARIQEDFGNWLNELKGLGIVPTYPVGDYLKVIESRLKNQDMAGTGKVDAIPFVKKIDPKEEKKIEAAILAGRDEGRKAFEARHAEIQAEEDSLKDIPKDAF